MVVSVRNRPTPIHPTTEKGHTEFLEVVEKFSVALTWRNDERMLSKNR